MAEHPEQFVEVVKLMLKAPWLAKFQRFLSRSRARRVFCDFFDRLDAHAQLQVRDSVHSLTGVPFRALPITHVERLRNDEFIALIHARLGVDQPCAEAIPSRCTCGKNIGSGHHLRHCPRGSGVSAVHNALRDGVRDMCANAGLVAQTEVRGLVPGSNCRPGDVVVQGGGRAGRDLVIDVTTVDALAVPAGVSAIELGRRRLVPGLQARRAEVAKRNKKGGVPPQSMEDRLKARDYTFCPLGFTSSGTPGTSWHPLLKKNLSLPVSAGGTTRPISGRGGQCASR